MFDHSIHSYSVLSGSRRIIAISDIHGNLPVFKKLLRKIAFDPEKSALFLVGDLLKKGSYSLGTLYYIMELSRHPHIYPMIGNCDVICHNVLYDTRLEFLQNILLNHPDSILHEMAQHVGQHIDKGTDMAALSRGLRKVFLGELTFIDRLPHVIKTERFIFVHAGIRDGKTYGRNIRDIMVQDLFMKKAGSFHKYIAIGYLPINEYQKSICRFSPIINAHRHIISIDGGGEVKSAGQLNALVYEQGRFQFTCSDHLEKARITRDIPLVNRTPFFITWHEGQIHVLCDEGACCLCRREASGKVIYIAKESLLYKGKGLHACDFTNYQISAGCENPVKIVSQTRNAILVEKQDLIGWIPTDTLALED